MKRGLIAVIFCLVLVISVTGVVSAREESIRDGDGGLPAYDQKT